MSEHIDICEHRDGSDDYLKPPKMRTHNGGEQIDTSKLHRQFVPTYDLDGPHRLKQPGPSIGTVILAVLVMAVTLAIVWLRVYP